MIRTLNRFLGFTLFCAAAFAADAPTMGSVLDGQFRGADREVVPLTEAMPADKFNFAPSAGEFKGVRTFAQQARHLSTVIYMLSASILGQKAPVDIGKDDAGPAAVASKEQIVEYMKGAFAFSHKALASITAQNAMDMVPSPFGGGQMQRIAAASFMMYHTYDHYGQMVEYLRMNGKIPPASLPRR